MYLRYIKFNFFEFKNKISGFGCIVTVYYKGMFLVCFCSFVTCEAGYWAITEMSAKLLVGRLLSYR
jgi:hypothetical protein